jgi:UDP-N-acetylmuramoyl-tripeptide--D-alanyl-D-alanine ligase
MSAIPENKAEFSLHEVLACTGGKLEGKFGREPFRGVGTDTRAALGGKLFVALRGEHYDAHDYLGAAAQAGALAALVERPVPGAPLPTIQVRSSLRAFGDLARLHRQRYRGKLLAVGGSAGKTTTRSAIGALLGAYQVPGNLNNLIGVPHVLLGLDRQPSAVIEIGTNAPGEVAELAGIALPDIAVLTLIGLEHTEGLGDLDGIEREEGALLSAAAVAVGNADDERVRRQLDACPASRKFRYGFSAGADVRGVSREPAGLGAQTLIVERGGKRSELRIPLLGDAGVYATLAALAVGDALGVDLARDPEALERALGRAGEPGRLRPVELGDGSVVLDDTYNSNPASVYASIAAARELARARGSRLLLVLGEMRELGAQSRSEHARVGEAVGKSRADALVAIAGHAELFVEPALAAGVDACFAVDAVAALALILERLRSGDVVLVKASRGVRAESVVEGLLAARGGSA